MPRDLLTRRPRPATRPAYSLVEVIAAIALMGATLVPAVELVRQGMDLSVETDRRQLLALYAASQVEQKLGASSMVWATGSYSGDYASDGHADIRFSTFCSDLPADGGVVGQLMDIRTTVYLDANQDDALSPGELNCSYRTKLGKFATYDALAP